MKVTNNPAANAGLVEQTRAAEKAKANDQAAKPSKATVAGGAQVNISEQAQLMNKASETAHAAPDVRADKVAALKAQILNGTYKIDSETVAEKLLQSHLDTDFGKNSL